MDETRRIAGCNPDGEMYIDYDAYFGSLEELEATVMELSDDESWLLSQWQAIDEAQSAPDRYAMEIYEGVLRRIGKPKSDIEHFLCAKATSLLNSLRTSDDEYVWEHLSSD